MQTIIPSPEMAIETIATNLRTQIIAFQEAIANREEGVQFPSLEETSIIVKLITCLEKLKRLATPFNGQKAIKEFIRFISAGDKSLGKTLNASYKEFQAIVNPTMPQETAAATKAIIENNPTQSTTTAANTGSPEVKGPENAFCSSTDMHPLTENDANKYSYVLDIPYYKPEARTWVKEKRYNTNWLQYNYFQYYLPVEERRFYTDEKTYHANVNHREYGLIIKQYFNEMMRKAEEKNNL